MYQLKCQDLSVNKIYLFSKCDDQEQNYELVSDV